MNNPVRISLHMANALEVTLQEVAKLSLKMNMRATDIQQIHKMRDELVVAIALAVQEERQRAAIQESMGQNTSSKSKDLG
jgi:hypothetical protein